MRDYKRLLDAAETLANLTGESMAEMVTAAFFAGLKCAAKVQEQAETDKEPERDSEKGEKE